MLDRIEIIVHGSLKAYRLSAMRRYGTVRSLNSVNIYRKHCVLYVTKKYQFLSISFCQSIISFVYSVRTYARSVLTVTEAEQQAEEGYEQGVANTTGSDVIIRSPPFDEWVPLRATAEMTAVEGEEDCQWRVQIDDDERISLGLVSAVRLDATNPNGYVNIYGLNVYGYKFADLEY